MMHHLHDAFFMAQDSLIDWQEAEYAHRQPLSAKAGETLAKRYRPLWVVRPSSQGAHRQ